MAGSNELILEKSHLYLNGVVVRCPITNLTVWAGHKSDVAAWARRNGKTLMDFRKDAGELLQRD